MPNRGRRQLRQARIEKDQAVGAAGRIEPGDA